MPYPSSMLCISGRINLGPKIQNRPSSDTRKKIVSIITVYNTMETALAAEIFSCDKKKTATADPPILVGEMADANSQIKTNSTECRKLNS